MGQALPDLRGLVGRTERLPQQRLRTAYFDTADERLWDRGLTLRHRTAEVGPGPTWTLKLPGGTAGSTLERTEVSWSGDRDEVPVDARSILRGLVRREPIRELVELETTRQRLALHDSQDTVVAEIDDDTVVVRGGPRDGYRFRQVELELHGDSQEIATIVTDRLERTGGEVGDAQKFAKATGLGAARGRATDLGKSSRLSAVVRSVIASGLDRLLDHDWRLRLTLPDATSEDVHQARVATRRLRSDLKTFDVVLDPVWVRHVRRDLKWLGTALGEMRDLDVLAHLVEGGPGEWRDRLASQRTLAGQGVASVLASDRYLALLDRLHAASREPPFLTEDHVIEPADAAREVLPAFVRRRWHTLRRQVKKGGSHPSDEQLHRIRIKAKQLRYASEAAAPVIGPRARRTAAAAENLQTVLGEHHDAVAAEAWLRQYGGEPTSPAASTVVSPRTAFEAGRLSADCHRRQRKLRHHWRTVFEDVSKSKARSWFA